MLVLWGSRVYMGPKVGVMGMCVYVYMLRVPRVYTRDTIGLRVSMGLRVLLGSEGRYRVCVPTCTCYVCHVCTQEIRWSVM